MLSVHIVLGLPRISFRISNQIGIWIAALKASMLTDCNLRYLIVCGMVQPCLDGICKLATTEKWFEIKSEAKTERTSHPEEQIIRSREWQCYMNTTERLPYYLDDVTGFPFTVLPPQSEACFLAQNYHWLSILCDLSRSLPSKKTQKEMERWHRGSRWQSMDENGPGSKCMAQVVEAICQQWHERLRWWWWWWSRSLKMYTSVRKYTLTQDMFLLFQFCTEHVQNALRHYMHF